MTRAHLFEKRVVLDEDVDALNLLGKFLSKDNAFEVTAGISSKFYATDP